MTDREAIDLFKRNMTYGGKNQLAKDIVTAEALAISALKEREERSKGCEYCRADSDGFVKKIGVFALSYSADENKTYLYSHACRKREINYCPMCGRPLEE